MKVGATYRIPKCAPKSSLSSLEEGGRVPFGMNPSDRPLFTLRRVFQYPVVEAPSDPISY